MKIFVIFLTSIFLLSVQSCSSGTKTVSEPVSETMSENDLIQRIATNIQSISENNLGPFQLMQIKFSIENMNYSYEELVALDQVVAERVKSQKISKEYSEAVYNQMVKALQENQNNAKPLLDYKIY